jgi:hypothetical protein
MNLNSDPKAWWDMINRNGQPGQQPSTSPFNDMMGQQQQPAQAPQQGNSALANWLRNPRQPGQSSAAQMPAPPQYTPPAAPAQQGAGDGDMTPTQILQNRGGLHPQFGQVSFNAHELPKDVSKHGYPSDDAFLRYIMQARGMSPYGADAAGVSGVSGNGPSGTDGGIY